MVRVVALTFPLNVNDVADWRSNVPAEIVPLALTACVEADPPLFAAEAREMLPVVVRDAREIAPVASFPFGPLP